MSQIKLLVVEKPNDRVGVDRLVSDLSLSLRFGSLEQRFSKTGPLTWGSQNVAMTPADGLAVEIENAID
jgi:hypothetical protein